MRLLVPVLALALATPATASAQSVSGDAISFKIEKERTRRQKITLISLGGAALVFGAVGLGFNLDSRSKSDEVSRAGAHTGLVWTAEREDTRQAAIRSRNVAIGGYAVGGGLALATAIYYIVTDPGEKEVSYEPGAPVAVVPVDGGAMVGARWSFR